MTTVPTTLPLWEDIKRDFIDTGLPHRLSLRFTPSLLVFTDAGASRMGALFELIGKPDVIAPSLLSQVAVSEVATGGKRYMEVSTAAPALYESFYRLIGQVSHAVLNGTAPHVALQSAVALWEALLSQASRLSEERQSGLFGELIILERLLRSGDKTAVLSWVGPHKQAHDFRRGHHEFEVKTTSSASRVHRINGITQLVASPDCHLFLISIQVTDAGTGGTTLPELIDRIRGLIKDDHTNTTMFEKSLEASGYSDRDRAHYARRRKLRSDIALIPVEDGVPRLVTEALNALPDIYSASRILHVEYDIDVSGLGWLDGLPEFLSIIPQAKGAQI